MDIDNSIIEAKKNSRWKGNFMTLYEHYQVENILKKGYALKDACELIGITEQEYKIMKAN